jgi:hypothetical protein
MTDPIKETAKNCIEAATKVLNGMLTLEQLKSCWRIEADKDKLLWRLMSEAEHFLVDNDIRSRDASYERYQRELLATLITDVKNKYDV